MAAIEKPNAATVNGSFSLDSVHFSYDGDSEEAEILTGLNLRAEPGQHVALLGVTGSGKSSLVHLLPRFYDTTGGAVAVDGIDVREWDPETLRSNISLVMQQPILFSGTIRQNIAYGRPDASMEDVLKAATTAQAHDFISKMQGGYDAIVEARGSNLSGGQKQRIAIARALLTDPAILILDDSTSAVDVETEFEIQAAFAARSKKMTTVIIAQRINSVLDADKIVILEAGKIVSEGTHDELMKSSIQYQEIYNSQFGEIGHG